jgi:hypothetical protein
MMIYTSLLFFSLIFSLLLIAVLLGLGNAASWLIYKKAQYSLQPSQNIAAGLCLLLLLGGLLVTGGIANRILDDLSILIGLILFGIFEVRAPFGTITYLRKPKTALKFLALMTSAWLVAILNTGYAVVNPNDDPSYAYLVRRLLEVGNLEDPFNFRRLTSFGGYSQLQAIFLNHLPNTFLTFPDFFVGAAIIILLIGFGQNEIKSYFTIGITIALLLAAPVMASNSSPVLIPIALELVVIETCFGLKRFEGLPENDKTYRFWIAIYLGGIAATAICIRTLFGLPILITIVIWGCLSGHIQRILYSLFGVASGLIFGTICWSLALWKSDRTPWYPLIPGNANPRFPFTGFPIAGKTVLKVVNEAFSSLWSPNFLIAILTIAVILNYFVSTVGRDKSKRLSKSVFTSVLTSLLGAIVLIVYLGYSWWNEGPPDTFSRFWVFSLIATLLAPLVIVVSSRANSRQLAISALTVASVMALTFAVTPAKIYDRAVRDGQAVMTLRIGKLLYGPSPQAEQSSYQTASTVIGPKTLALVAVDNPELMISLHHRMSDLDVPGAASPNRGSFPYFTAPINRIEWLRNHSYHAIIAMNPTQSNGLYSRTAWQLNIEKRNFYAAWSFYALNWDAFVEDLNRIPTVHSTVVGNLVIARF